MKSSRTPINAMAVSTIIKYFIAGVADPISADSPYWDERLPMERSGASLKADVSFADYFQAVECFLTEASTWIHAGLPDPAKASTLEIHLEKHGAFYHPSRIVMAMKKGGKHFFAVNVALSQAGRANLEREYQCLKKLRDMQSADFVPTVYATADIPIRTGIARMMLGDWFEGFHEFHLSMRRDEKQGIRLWKPAHDQFLSPTAVHRVYHEATHILTYYYNLITGEQIFPWHHAAGDFVVKLENGLPTLRLITVRQYEAMLEFDPENPEEILYGLLIFFLNTTIRMRLDRLDGIGEIVWADQPAVAGIVSGFLAALAEKPKLSKAWTDIPLVAWEKFFGTLSDDTLLEIATEIVDAYSPAAPDLPMIRSHLSDHVGQVAESMRQANIISFISAATTR